MALLNYKPSMEFHVWKVSDNVLLNGGKKHLSGDIESLVLQSYTNYYYFQTSFVEYGSLPIVAWSVNYLIEMCYSI